MSSIGATQDESNVKCRTVQESLRFIDEQIAMHELSIIRLKSQRNEFAPISRLPPEILGTIFVFAAARARALPLSLWFNFSYVCKLWRDVALTTPNIWSFIPLHYRQWATTILERSKTTDLILDLDFNLTTPAPPRVQFMKDVLSNHAPRIRELYLNGFLSSTLSILIGNIQPSSFRLRCLQLAGNGDTYPTFPVNLIADSEGLRHLDVVKCDLAWCSMPLNGLTFLKMNSTLNRPLWVDFIPALKAMPNLTTLEMRDSLPLAGGIFRKTTPPVRLANLQRLDLRSTKDMNEVRNVLSSIVVPQLAIINIYGGADHSSQNANLVSDFASSLSTFISEMIPESKYKKPIFYQTLTVESIFGQVNLEAWKADLDPEGPRGGIPNLDLSLSHLPHSTEKMLRDCTKHLPLTRLKTLCLHTDISKLTLVDCFGRLPQLRHVTLSGSVTLSFIKALVHKSKYSGRRRNKSTFPALQSLKIQEAIFSPDHEGGFSFDDLQDGLIDRCNRNSEIQKLTLSNCFSIYEEDVNLLREIVVDVVWDGHEEEYYSDDYDEDDVYSDDYSDDYNYGDDSELELMYSF